MEYAHRYASVIRLMRVHYFYFDHFCALQGLSRDRDGLLIVEMDLNLCRQFKDYWGFRMTQRLSEYGRDISRAAQLDFKPQVITRSVTASIEPNGP